MWDSESLTNCIEDSRILISNDYELELIMESTGLDKAGLLQLTGCIITTMGQQGSRITTPEGEINVPTVKSRQVVDPTGAGDAFAAGFLYGLLCDIPYQRCAEIANRLAAGIVAVEGCDYHRLDHRHHPYHHYRCLHLHH